MVVRLEVNMPRLTLCRPGRYRQRAVRYHVSVGAFSGAPMKPNSVVRYDLEPGIHELTLEYSRGRSVVVAVQLSDKPSELIFLRRSRLLLLNAPPAIIDAETHFPLVPKPTVQRSRNLGSARVHWALAKVPVGSWRPNCSWYGHGQVFRSWRR